MATGSRVLSGRLQQLRSLLRSRCAALALAACALPRRWARTKSQTCRRSRRAGSDGRKNRRMHRSDRRPTLIASDASRATKWQGTTTSTLSLYHRLPRSVARLFVGIASLKVPSWQQLNGRAGPAHSRTRIPRPVDIEKPKKAQECELLLIIRQTTFRSERGFYSPTRYGVCVRM